MSFLTREELSDLLRHTKPGRYMMKAEFPSLGSGARNCLIDIFEDYPGNQYWTFAGDHKVWDYFPVKVKYIHRIFSE